MAFAEEWVNKKNKTPTTAGDKLNADDLNLLARGIFEALAQGGSGDITKISQLINDVGFITKDDVPSKLSQFINDVGFIGFKDDIENRIEVFGSDGGITFAVALLKWLCSAFTLDANYITIQSYGNDINVIGSKFAIEEPVNANHAASKGYVDDLVGDIGIVLAKIVALEESYIGGDV